ncbi:MAG: MraY family glycosyltransferase [Mucinivorans sp.]
MSLLYFTLLTFFISAAIGYLAIPRIVVIAKVKRLFDQPDARKVHSGSIPRLGGISFFPGAMFSFAFVLGLRYYLGYELSLAREGNLMVEFLFMISGMLMLFFIGLTDDLVGVGYRTKFIVQVYAGTALLLSGLGIDSLQGFLGVVDLPIWISGFLTVLVVVFVINAFNLIDGVDGLCSGLGAIILTVLGAWYIVLGEFVYSMFAFGMVGVVVVFFQYNIRGNRMKIFMGDTGSLTLGYMIIFLGLKFISIDTNTYPDAYQIHSSIALLFGLMFVPVFDTFRVFISRISRGKSPFYPDKTHIHHKLLAMGFTHLQNTAILLITEVAIFGLTIVMSEVLEFNVNIVIVVLCAIGVFANMMINKRIAKISLSKQDKNV